MIRQSIIAIAVSLLSASAHAAIVNITVRGTVDFNVIQGNQTNVPDGAPVVMSFNVDSNVFTNSGSFPTRGYNILLPSFSLSVGGQPINVLDPQPTPPAYFVLRNNDPLVDGFFISSQQVDQFSPVNVAIPGLAPVHDLDFHATYNGTTTLSSLNILDAVGTYDLTNISVYQWSVGRFGNNGAEYAYESLTISVVPGPGAMAITMLGGLFFPARRRRA